MSRYRSQNKNFWRSNKPETVDQPVTQVLNQRQNKKRETKLNLSELKPPQSVRPQDFIEKEQSASFQNNLFLNKPKNAEKESLKFEIKCSDKCCEVDDVMSVLSFGGYSVKSKIDKPNEIVHNHRKINKETVYNYLEDQIPYLEVFDFDDDIEQQNMSNKNDLKLKKDWKKSPFAPLFYTKLDNINHIERQTLHHQKRQKEIIQTHQKNLFKEAENEKNKYTKNYSTYSIQRPLKKINNQQSSNHQKNKSQRSNNTKFEPNSALQKGKIKTRLQQKRFNNDDFEMSKLPQPSNKHCYPCKIKFENYKEHVESSQHRLNVQKALGSSLFIQEMKNLENMKKKQINSQESKMLEQFANFLQKIVENNDQYISKKHHQLRVSLKQINDEIQRFLRM